jgi:hypothetical protein
MPPPPPTPPPAQNVFHACEPARARAGQSSPRPAKPASSGAPVAASGTHIVIVRSMDAESRQGGGGRASAGAPAGAAAAAVGGAQATECTQSSCPMSSASRVALNAPPPAANRGRGAKRVSSGGSGASPSAAAGVPLAGAAAPSGATAHRRMYLSWEALASSRRPSAWVKASPRTQSWCPESSQTGANSRCPGPAPRSSRRTLQSTPPSASSRQPGAPGSSASAALCCSRVPKRSLWVSRQAACSRSGSPPPPGWAHSHTQASPSPAALTSSVPPAAAWSATELTGAEWASSVAASRHGCSVPGDTHHTRTVPSTLPVASAAGAGAACGGSPRSAPLNQRTQVTAPVCPSTVATTRDACRVRQWMRRARKEAGGGMKGAAAGGMRLRMPHQRVVDDGGMVGAVCDQPVLAPI